MQIAITNQTLSAAVQAAAAQYGFSPSAFATGIMYAATADESADKLPAFLQPQPETVKKPA